MQIGGDHFRNLLAEQVGCAGWRIDLLLGRHGGNRDAQVVLDLAGHVHAELRRGRHGEEDGKGRQERAAEGDWFHWASLASNLRGLSHFHWS